MLRRTPVLVRVLVPVSLGLVALGLVPAGAASAHAASAHAAPSASGRPSCRLTLAAYPTLHPGDRRPAVRTLQCLLDQVGLGPVAVDGWYGPQTRRAIHRLTYEGMEGVPPHPYVVRDWYWVLLFGRSHDLAGLALGDHGIRVRTLQRALRAGGVSVVVDGAYGPQTRARVREFQQACRLRVSGRVDESTAFTLAGGGCRTWLVTNRARPAGAAAGSPRR
jgi:peptidoglycan hydrolase-like protein with peptidoglycan-binding domain